MLHISERLSDQLNSYSAILGKSSSMVVEEALGDWLDTIGEARIAARGESHVENLIGKDVQI
jgi:hypothetical protein